MKLSTTTIVEVIGGIVACIGVGMLSVPVALITAGVLVVVACEANA